MIIQGVKRIRNWEKYSSNIQNGESFFIGVKITEEIHNRVIHLGFEAPFEPGQALTPTFKNGPISKFNSFGRHIPQKNLPKERAYRELYWTWKQFDGTEHSRIIDVSYLRYPRKYIEPPSCELVIVQNKNNKFIMVGADPVVKGQTDPKLITHKINLLLEIFKYAEILKENMEAYEVPEIIRLNWEIIPQGEAPWKVYKKHLLQKASKGKKIIVEDRLDTIEKYNPDIKAIGRHGYNGYLIYGFSLKNLFVFESALYGNAIYIFEGDWEAVSQLTKAEIINGSLCKARIPHTIDWKNKIHQLLAPKASIIKIPKVAKKTSKKK